jgi:hypothetical protein
VEKSKVMTEPDTPTVALAPALGAAVRANVEAQTWANHTLPVLFMEPAP